MNFWWGSLLGRLFPVGRMSNFWPVGEGLPPPSPVEKSLLSPPKKKSVENFKPLIWLKSLRIGEISENRSYLLSTVSTISLFQLTAVLAGYVQIKPTTESYVS